MRFVYVILLYALAAGLPALGAPPGEGRVRIDKGAVSADKPGFAVAQRFIDRAQPRRAITVYATMLERDPDDERAQLGLAVAQAAVSRCAPGAPVLARLRAGPLWSAEAAAADARCLALAGDLAQAVAAAEEALTLAPSVEHARLLAELAAAARDLEAWEAALPWLDADEGRDTEVLLYWVTVGAALDVGDTDLDFVLERALSSRLIRGDPLGRARLHALDGRRWMDLGDPSEALRVLDVYIHRRAGNPDVLSWAMEAARREGDPVTAAAGLHRMGLRIADGVVLDSLRARARVDLGEVETAAALLDAYGDLDHPELLASRWYLARALGDEDAMITYARRWNAVNQAPGRALAQLVPLNER